MEETSYLIHGPRLLFAPPTLRDIARRLDARRVIREAREVANPSIDILAVLFEVCIKRLSIIAKLAPFSTHFEKTRFQIPLRKLTPAFLEKQCDVIRPMPVATDQHLVMLLKMIAKYFRVTDIGSQLLIPLPIVWLLVMRFAPIQDGYRALLQWLEPIFLNRDESVHDYLTHCIAENTLVTWQGIPYWPANTFSYPDYDSEGHERWIYTLDPEMKTAFATVTSIQRDASREGTNSLLPLGSQFALPLTMVLIFAVLTRQKTDAEKMELFNDPTAIWQKGNTKLQRRFMSVLIPDTRIQLDVVPFWLFSLVDQWQQFRA